MGVGFVQGWGPRGGSNGRVQGRGQRGSQLQQGGQQKRRGWEQGKSFLCRGATGWPGRAGKAGVLPWRPSSLGMQSREKCDSGSAAAKSELVLGWAVCKVIV